MAKKFRQRENTASLTKQMLGIEEPQETEKSERVLPTEESRTPSSEDLLSTHFQEQQKANEKVSAYMQDFNEEHKQIISEMAKQLYDEPIPDKSQFMDELLKDYHSLREEEQPKAFTPSRKKIRRDKKMLVLLTEQKFMDLKETAQSNNISVNELINQFIDYCMYGKEPR